MQRYKRPLHYVFFGIPSIGHTTPTLFLVKALIQLGNKVTYYNIEAFRNIIEKTDANFCDYNSPTLVNISLSMSSMKHDEITVELHKIFLVSAYEILNNLKYDDSAFDVVIYDQMAIWGYIFSENMKLPSFCSNTMFLFTYDEIINQLPNISKYIDDDYNNRLQSIKSYYKGFKSYKYLLKLQSCLKSKNIITYSPYELQSSKHKYFGKNYIFLGNRFDSSYIASSANLSRGSIIYISLGTVFNEKIELFKLFINFFSTTNYKIIISAGKNESIYQFLKSYNYNQNIIIYRFVNQLEMLTKASVFITHAGFNSMYEGLYFTVPMIMIPQVPEQKFNALKVVKLKAGIFLGVDVVSTESLSMARNQMKIHWSSFKTALRSVRKILLNSDDNKSAIKKMEDILFLNEE